MSKGKNKNIARVQSMLDGTYGGKKTQVGLGSVGHHPNDGHKVGDRWTDSEGVEWEQKEGYRSKVSRLPDVGLFSKQCKDCDRNCSLDKRHNEAWIKFDRCWYCQLNFELKLQSFPGKWEAWVRLQQLNNMDIIERDMIQALEEDNSFDNKIRKFDESVSNALSNYETEQTIERNKKLTGQ